MQLERTYVGDEGEKSGKSDFLAKITALCYEKCPQTKSRRHLQGGRSALLPNDENTLEKNLYFFRRESLELFLTESWDALTWMDVLFL